MPCSIHGNAQFPERNAQLSTSAWKMTTPGYEWDCHWMRLSLVQVVCSVNCVLKTVTVIEKSASNKGHHQKKKKDAQTSFACWLFQCQLTTACHFPWRNTDEKHLLAKSWEVMERQTIFQCAGCSTPLMTDKTGVQSQREEGRTLTSRALAWTIITSCQHQSEEAVNLGDLMRLWVRSRVQNYVFRLFTLNRIGHLEWQGALPTDTLSRYEAKPACAEHLCLAGSQNPCPTAVHITLLLLSLRKKKNTKCMWTCVLLLLLCLWWLLLSWTWSVLWLSCVSFVAVMCTFLCVRPMWLSCYWSHQFCGFSSIDLIRSQYTYVFLLTELRENFRRGYLGSEKPQLEIERYPIGRNTLYINDSLHQGQLQE